jgi:hypothetical protein
MDWTAVWAGVAGGAVTLLILVLLMHRPSQIREERMLRRERRYMRYGTKPADDKDT